MAADTQLEAIITAFDGSPAKADVNDSGGLWFGEVPSVKVFPFVGLADGGTGPPDYNTEDDYTEQTSFSFFVLHTDKHAAEATGTKIKQAFDKPGQHEAIQAFPMTNAVVTECLRQNYLVSVDPQPGPDDKTVFVVQIDYLMTVRKTKGTN